MSMPVSGTASGSAGDGRPAGRRRRRRAARPFAGAARARRAAARAAPSAARGERPCARAPRIGGVGMSTPFGTISHGPPSHASADARPLGHRDPLVDAIHQEPRHPGASTGSPGRVVGRDGRLRQRQDGDADRGRHRLVEVEHVEALPLEHAPDPEERARAEHDVRQGAVRRDDHRPADGDHVRRRVAVPAYARVERARERPGGSLPITRRTSWPRASSAAACSSACSTTAPQNDQENGTTMPTFTIGSLLAAPRSDRRCGYEPSGSSFSQAAAGRGARPRRSGRGTAPDAGEVRRPCLGEPPAAVGGDPRVQHTPVGRTRLADDEAWCSSRSTSA